MNESILNNGFIKASTSSPNPFTPCNRYGERRKTFDFNFTQLATPHFAQPFQKIAEQCLNLNLSGYGAEADSYPNTPIEGMDKRFVYKFRENDCSDCQISSRSKAKPYLKKLDTMVDQFSILRNEFQYNENGEGISPINTTSQNQIFSPKFKLQGMKRSKTQFESQTQRTIRYSSFSQSYPSSRSTKQLKKSKNQNSPNLKKANKNSTMAKNRKKRSFLIIGSQSTTENCSTRSTSSRGTWFKLSSKPDLDSD